MNNLSLTSDMTDQHNWNIIDKKHGNINRARSSESETHINDLFQLKKISQIDFNYRISKLTKQWDKFHKQLTRGD